MLPIQFARFSAFCVPGIVAPFPDAAVYASAIAPVIRVISLDMLMTSPP
ncbi:MAG: hypothetical protein IJK23_12290 [Clostridia bacterium]|nr:hypothetical protein [Clostridia bacterium]